MQEEHRPAFSDVDVMQRRVEDVDMLRFKWEISRDPLCRRGRGLCHGRSLLTGLADQ